MAVETKEWSIADVVRRELPQNYCREVVQLTVGAGQITYVGMPLVVTPVAGGIDTAVTVKSAVANEAAVNAIALQTANAVAPNPAVNILCLRRSPCIVDWQQVVRAMDRNPASAACVDATVYEALKALGILPEDEPGTTKVAFQENADTWE